MRYSYTIFLIRKSEGKTSPTRPMHGWEDNIKVDLTKKKQNIIVWTTFIWFKIGARDEYWIPQRHKIS
jgi:hypothetical protein